MDPTGSTAPPVVPSSAVASTFPHRSRKTDLKQRRHSTPHISDGTLLSQRLAILAPKSEDGGQSAHLHATVRLKNLTKADGLLKEKLPPRSRTGCWTCRTRKVKCDEEHPRCGQCVRLQHQCDYSPRLSFRDDTPRIIERMQEVSTEGSSVWDPHARNTRRSLDLTAEYPIDATSLPLFCELTNDEDREMKASTRIPGTYNLICNPSSFSATGLEDTDEEYDASPLSPGVPRIKQEASESEQSNSATSSTRNLVFASSEEAASDPDIVILRRFEEPIAKRVPSQLSNQRKASTISLSGTLPLLSSLELVSPISPRQPSPSTLLKNTITPNDQRYLQYYTDVVAPRIFHLGGLGPVEVDHQATFERESLEFPPLFHAIMALSALSLNQKDGNTTSVDSLRHYQLALPELKTNLSSTADLTSDVHLYTHFFLLLYEIAAVEQRESLWQPQLLQLKRMLLARPKITERGTTLFVIWFIIILDVYAALSAGGTGEVIEALIKADRIPNICHLFEQNERTGHSPVFRDIEREVFLHVLSLYQNLLFSGASLARLCREIRDSQALGDLVYSGGMAQQYDLPLRQSQIEHELQNIKDLWAQHEQAFELLDPNQQNSNSLRVNSVFEQCEIFYQTCVIFSRTSMWSGQRQTMDDNAISEVNNAIQTILSLAQSQSEKKPPPQGLGSLLFPLFLAGSVSTSGSEKMWVLELFGPLESRCIGRTNSVIKDALQIIYQRQNEDMMNIGHNMGVDWQDVLKEIGVRIVSFGL